MISFGVARLVVRADMADRASLRSALRDAHGVFSVQNPMVSGIEAEILQARTVAEAAAEAGIGHFVYAPAGIGERGTGVGSWESKLDVEERLRELGLPHTLLRPMAFMELMNDKGYYPPVAMWHVMPKLTGPDLPIHWISVEDVGAIVAPGLRRWRQVCGDGPEAVRGHPVQRAVPGRVG